MAEDKHFDVVILGSGIAGLAAALAAHDHGLRAALVEKTAVLGGTSSDSYGLIWAGANHLLLAAGQQDAREATVLRARIAPDAWHDLYWPAHRP